MKKNHSFKDHRTRHGEGFSLLELLIVISIMAILMVLGGNFLSGSSRGLQLTQAADDLRSSLLLGRQMAQSHNKYVQVRFYKPSSGDGSYTLVGLFLADSPLYGQAQEYDAWLQQGRFSPLQKVHRLPSPCVMLGNTLGSQNASQLLNNLATDTVYTRTGSSTIAGVQYNWVAFYFCPDGSTDLDGSGSMYGAGATPGATPDTYITLSDGNPAASKSNSVPTNFAAVVITPTNGRVSLYRP